DGETDGDACALKTYAPGFHTKIIAQASKLAEQANLITVTLRSNEDFVSTSDGLFSEITISGLTGSDTPDTSTIADLSTTGDFVPASGTPFVPSFTAVQWIKAAGELRLRLAVGECTAPTVSGGVNVCIKAGSTYVFALMLINGKVAQTAPAVSISVLYRFSSEKYTASQVMSRPVDAKLAALALLSKDTLLDTYNIGQQNKLNAICVTLRTNKDLQSIPSGGGSRFVAFTIKGLDGFQTDSQDLAIRTATTLSGVSAGTTAVTSGTADIGDFFCPTAECASGQENKLAFDEVKGEASFFLKSSKTMKQDSNYSFCFQMTNPKRVMACKTATISAKDPATSTAAAIEFTMTQDTSTKCAGFTTVRSFSRATFRVDSNVTGHESTAFVELIANYKVSTQTAITISGLSGFTAKGQGAISEVVAVDLLSFTANGLHDVAIGNSGTWDGTSTLTFTTGGSPTSVLDSYTALDSTPTGDFVYVMSFKIVNPAVAQAAPRVSITVSDAFVQHEVESGLASPPPVINSVCYALDARPTAGICAGMAMPSRVCDGASGRGSSGDEHLFDVIETWTDPSYCEGDMAFMCPMITAGATGVTGDAACGLVCAGAAYCSTGTFPNSCAWWFSVCAAGLGRGE
ncbi:hypothetical protein T484DRAFT_1781159, partial [Baffinella frigidus]